MSFIILLLIIILLYATLTKYSGINKVIFMTAIITGMTAAFAIYGLTVFKTADSWIILNTQMNRATFIHACIIWSAADLIVIFKMIKNYRYYIEVNS
ncbi:MAG: hypothetical protein CVV49_11530 [Spirochaetae bacterium HGW-Spirochaetae-5]|nr:MAG: hypothetical protein CVV49_11530 [Spirochaetae bacterium HGW-Spirochaetae-5]